MKRVFKFKVGQNWDGDEEMLMFLEDYLTSKNFKGYFPIVRSNFKVIINIEQETEDEK